MTRNVGTFPNVSILTDQGMKQASLNETIQQDLTQYVMKAAKWGRAKQIVA